MLRLLRHRPVLWSGRQRHSAVGQFSFCTLKAGDSDKFPDEDESLEEEAVVPDEHDKAARFFEDEEEDLEGGQESKSAAPTFLNPESSEKHGEPEYTFASTEEALQKAKEDYLALLAAEEKRQMGSQEDGEDGKKATLRFGSETLSFGEFDDIKAVAEGLTDEQRDKLLKEYMSFIDAGAEEDNDDRLPMMDDDTPRPTEINYQKPEYPFPYQDEHVERIYPFEMTIQTRVTTKDEEEHHLLEDYQHVPYKSKLTIYRKNIRPFMTPLQEEIFNELVGVRFSPKKAVIELVSRHLPNMWANENRVFQYFDALLWESKRLADEFEKQDSTEDLEAEEYLRTRPKSFSRFNPKAKVPRLAKEVLEAEQRELEQTREAALA